jgi:hypothetical protein
MSNPTETRFNQTGCGKSNKMYLCLLCCGGSRGEGKNRLNFKFEILYSGSEVSVTYSKVIIAPSFPLFFCRPLKHGMALWGVIWPTLRSIDLYELD